MSRLVSQIVARYDLGGEEWIEYREQMSYAELEQIMVGIDSKNEAANLKMAIPLLQAGIVNWHLVDDDGAQIPFEKEKIKQLDSTTVLALFGEMVKKYFPEKKSTTV